MGKYPLGKHAFWRRVLMPCIAAPRRPARADEAPGGALPLGSKLTRLVLTPGSATPGAARRGSPAPYDSTGRRRSPWQLVADSPASHQRSSQTPLSQPRRSPVALASPAAAPASGAPGSRWQQLQHQLLQRCQADEGGVRITAAKARAKPAAPEPAPAPSPAAKPAAAPAPIPELPPYSLAGAGKPAAVAAPAAATPAAPAAPAFGAAPAGGLFGAASVPAFGGAALAGADAASSGQSASPLLSGVPLAAFCCASLPPPGVPCCAPRVHLR